MVEEAILVLRVMSLRYLVLIQRFLRFAEETVAIAEISAHIGIIASERDRLLVVLDCVRPILPVIIPVGERRGGVGGCEMRDFRRVLRARFSSASLAALRRRRMRLPQRQPHR